MTYCAWNKLLAVKKNMIYVYRGTNTVVYFCATLVTWVNDMFVDTADVEVEITKLQMRRKMFKIISRDHMR